MLPRPFSDKRSSTGNLCYFTDQFDNHPWENPELNQTLRNTVRYLKKKKQTVAVSQTGLLHYIALAACLKRKNGTSQVISLKCSNSVGKKDLTLVFRLVGERAARKRVVVVTLREAMLMRRDLIRQPPCRLWQVCAGDNEGGGDGGDYWASFTERVIYRVYY